VKVAIYARVSTERQAERGTIGSQLAALRDQVSTAGHQLISEFIDDGYSGARLDRPGLDALRDAAEAGLFDAVWCLSPDRLARVCRRTTSRVGLGTTSRVGLGMVIIADCHLLRRG
jgi:site-specific DNA recombinase